MSEVSGWLDGRTPPPPPELRQALDAALGGPASAGGAPASALDALGRGARACLEASISRPGRVRESAFDLLTADALLTYACEAALESDDPESTLQGLVSGLLEAEPDR